MVVVTGREVLWVETGIMLMLNTLKCTGKFSLSPKRRVIWPNIAIMLRLGSSTPETPAWDSDLQNWDQVHILFVNRYSNQAYEDYSHVDCVPG